MKKYVVNILVFVMALTFIACGQVEEVASDIEIKEEEAENIEIEEEENETDIIIEAKDCYGNAGYVEFIAGAEDTTVYTFTAENSDTVKWSIYVLDEVFNDGFRYIGQAFEPVLEGDGDITVNEGQFVYVHCSVNEFTEDAADENAKLIVSVK